MPDSRYKLAIPFVGKDTPSSASEYAHPDVIIGLSLTGYRVQKLRKGDVDDLVRILKRKLANEHGHPQDKPTEKLYRRWVNEAGHHVSGDSETASIPTLQSGRTVGDESSSLTVPSLAELKKANAKEMDSVFKAIRGSPSVIKFYLNDVIFPK
jgi:hypothetical protein